MTPTNGGTSNSLSPKLVVDFDVQMLDYIGNVTLTGNMGTSQTYAVSSSNITWDSTDKTMTVTPTAPFKPGELITVTFSGIQDAKCFNASKPPTWSFTTIVPPCTPGQGGMVGATTSKIASGITSISEYYVAADDKPSGWIYVGGTSDLYRVNKSSGTLENVETLASLTFSNLGYGMLVDGDSVFSLDSTTSNKGILYRLTTNSGTNWNVEDYAWFQGSPSDSIRGAAAYKNKIYMVTNETSTSANVEIWSADAGAATVPTAGTFVTAVSGERYCSGIAVDDNYFYLACGTNERLIRVQRTTGAVTLIADLADLSTVKNEVHPHDTDSNGTADFLYYKGSRGEVFFICNPDGSTPYADKLASYGSQSSASMYGLGFDPVAKTLYAYDDATEDIIVIK